MDWAFSRRTFLGFAVGALLSTSRPRLLGNAAAAREGLKLGAAKPFSFEALVERAREMAATAYTPPYRPAPPIVAQIDYGAHGEIRFRRDSALFASSPGIYPVTFFHLGRYFPSRVAMHVVEGKTARKVRYSSEYFDMPKDSVARRLPPDAGFAGFRLHESLRRADWQTQDWVAFLGASYFRAIGALGQYGISARGIAVDTAMPTPEEFPEFVEIYIAPAMAEDEPVLVYALLDGPSITGAYRFAIQRTEGVMMEIDKRLFVRQAMSRLGIAPLTSMFWYAEYNRECPVDWRPEVHDSDGLALWTSSGERLWRPLNNPPRTITSSFLDSNPRGFGLLQRDRNFDHYLDGVHYERRPSLWVEPLDDWGRGAVQLVEIPTDDEIHDNIAAFWVPEDPVRAGAAYTFRYRLHWLADEPYPPANARTVATRTGRGGEPGKPRPEGVSKFIVEFAGGPLENVEPEAQPEAVISASRGELSSGFAEPVPSTKRWRVQFDLTVRGSEPIEVRAYLRFGDRAISETWLYQYHPN